MSAYNENNVLVDCIAVLTKFYGIRGDVRAAVSEIVNESDGGSDGFKDLSLVAEKLGCISEEVDLKIEQIGSSHIPVLLSLSDGSFRIFFPEKTQGGTLYCPGVGPCDETLDSISSIYTGKALLVTPAKTSVQAHIDHMIKGFAIDWFWEPVRKNWPSYFEILLCSFFINVLVLTMPLYTMNIYDRVVASYAEYTLVALTVGIMLALIFDTVFKSIRSYILESIAAHTGTGYDVDLMERLMRIKPFAMEMSVGERANIFRELQGIKDFFASRLIPTVVDLPFFIMFCVVIYMISHKLVLFPIIGFVLIIVINIIGRSFLSRSTKAYFSTMQDKTTVLVETLAGMQTIQQFNATGNRLFKWRFSSSRSADAAQRNRMVVSVVSSLSYLTAQLVHVSLVSCGALEIVDNELTIGGLLACTILSGRAMSPIISSSGVLGQLRQSLDILITIDKIFQLPFDEPASENTSSKGSFNGLIELKGITARYQHQARNALNDVSLTFKPGEKVGLIGRTGAGKSTLVKIIYGALKPESGEVLFDNFALDTIPSTELHRNVGVVPQDPFFFFGSIRDNIALGEGMVDDKALEEAVHLSGLDLVLDQTVSGLDTEVGENGCRLSGGQKQAISLARALIRKPSIIIFDEPTTGMDTMLENRVKQTLKEYLADRTFIMITHRTSLLPLVDRLVLLDNGKLIADGPREDVIRRITAQG